MGIKIDKFFLCLCIFMFVLVSLDIALTVFGINLGFAEGNQLINFLFNYLGIELTIIIYEIFYIITLILLIIIRQKTKEESTIRFLNLSMVLMLIIKSFIVGTWVGLIQSVI